MHSEDWRMYADGSISMAPLGKKSKKLWVRPWILVGGTPALGWGLLAQVQNGGKHFWKQKFHAANERLRMDSWGAQFFPL